MRTCRALWRDSPSAPIQASSSPAASQCVLPTQASEAEEHMEECASAIHSGLSQDSGRKIYILPENHIFFIILIQKNMRYCTKDVNFCKEIGRHAIKAALPAYNEESEWTVKDHVMNPLGFRLGLGNIRPLLHFIVPVFVIWLASSLVRGAQPF